MEETEIEKRVENVSTKAIAVPINIGAVIRGAAKSGRGLPQSKTLRAT